MIRAASTTSYRGDRFCPPAISPPTCWRPRDRVNSKVAPIPGAHRHDRCLKGTEPW